MNKEDSIKTLDRYFHLKRLFLKYRSGNSTFFVQEVGISRRSFYRYLNYMTKKDEMNITYDNARKMYILDDG